MHAQEEQELVNTTKSFLHTVDVDYQYLAYSPEDHSEMRNGLYPLLIFLHGAGERGTDPSLLKVHGPPKLIDAGKKFPFYVISPQCHPNEIWDIHKLKYLIEDFIQNNPIDRKRIYLTGLSMGGYGTWALAIDNPNMFAAIAPICGGSDIDAWMAPKIKDVPTWAFHGALDRVVSIENSVNIVNNLKAAEGNVKFTVYPEAGHDSWTVTYDNPELYKWMLKHENNRNANAKK